MQTFPAYPIVICTGVDWHFWLFNCDVNKAIPTSPDEILLVTDSSADRTFVCSISRAEKWGFCVLFHWNTSNVQKSPPIRIEWVLHTGGVKFGNGYERPAFCIPFNVKQRMYGFRGIQVVNTFVF